MNAIRKLIEMSASETARAVDLNGLRRGLTSLAVPAELSELLSARNGLYAFEGALHVFPDRGERGGFGLVEWNQRELWMSAYGDILPSGLLFFAEDAFGGQFAITDGVVVSFEPETGELAHVGDSLLEWAQAILVNYEYMTGHPLAHAWQVRYGALTAGYRLNPRIPFVCGGEYSVENLNAVPSDEGLRQRARLATAIRDLPDGATLSWPL